MAREQVPFDDKTYEHILEALVNCKQSHHAYHMIRVAVKERVFYPKVEHYILLMAAFIRTHEPNMVFDVNQMMTAAGMGQSAQRLSKLLDALGRWRELPAHLRAAGARGQYYVNLAMEEFAKAHRRESPILREDRRAWASLYARMTFILIQFRDLATTQQLIETFQTKMWGEAPPGRVAGLPKNLVHSILLADFYDGNYDAVQKTWDMLFARTRAQGRARLVAAATRPEKGDEDTTGQDQQQGGTVVKSYQYSLCTPLKTMQRLYLAQKDAWGLRHLFTDVQRAGFLIDSKNWNYHIQILARLKHWQEAFRVCEDKLMPQWTGWKTRRARQRVTTALPLAFRRLASVGSYLRPTSYTIMVLAREYIALQEMAPWSRDVARLLQDVRNQCPRVVGAMATMSSRIRIEDLDPAEPDFGAETTGEEDEGEEAAEAEDEEVSQSGDAQRARRELLAWQQQEERGQDEQRRRDQAQYAAAQMAFARAQERRSERRGRERAAAPAPSAQKEEE
ncbi:hypothetical protein P8C59_000592 [Phyllachora maydis]|nr:hypothetical protein P8C59_000592 [Phyllachora maydis]